MREKVELITCDICGEALQEGEKSFKMDNGSTDACENCYQKAVDLDGIKEVKEVFYYD